MIGESPRADEAAPRSGGRSPTRPVPLPQGYGDVLRGVGGRFDGHQLGRAPGHGEVRGQVVGARGRGRGPSRRTRGLRGGISRSRESRGGDGRSRRRHRCRRCRRHPCRGSGGGRGNGGRGGGGRSGDRGPLPHGSGARGRLGGLVDGRPPGAARASGQDDGQEGGEYVRGAPAGPSCLTWGTIAFDSAAHLAPSPRHLRRYKAGAILLLAVAAQACSGAGISGAKGSAPGHGGGRTRTPWYERAGRDDPGPDYPGPDYPGNDRSCQHGRPGPGPSGSRAVHRHVRPDHGTAVRRDDQPSDCGRRLPHLAAGVPG